MIFRLRNTFRNLLNHADELGLAAFALAVVTAIIVTVQTVTFA